MIGWIIFGLLFLIVAGVIWRSAVRKGSANIIGALAECSSEDWKRAFNELMVTLIFGLFPVWVPFALHLMIGDQGWDTILEQVDEGQLFFVATALLAPIFYFTFPSARNPNGQSAKPFPSQQILIGVFIGTVVVSALAVSILDFPVVNLNGQETLKSRMVSISVALFAFASVFYFLSLVVRNWLDRGGVESMLDKRSKETDEAYPPPDRLVRASRRSAEDLVAQTLAGGKKV